MSGRAVEDFENEGGAVAPEEGGGGQEERGSGGSAPAADEFKITREDWEKQQRALVSMAGLVEQLFEPDEPEDEEEEFSVPPEFERYLNKKFEGLMAPVAPVIRDATEERGSRIMKEHLAKLKRSVGDFDDSLAEKVAESYFKQNPSDPVGAVVEAAKYAAAVRKQEREAGLVDYKKKLGRSSELDPGVDGGAASVRPREKTYEEVIDRWAQTDEL